MSSQTTMMALVLVGCCCVSAVTAGGLWAGNVFCDKTNPDSQAVGMNCAAVYERSPAPAPGPKSPAPAPAPGPATAADGFAVGVSVNCKANDPSTATITGGAGGGGTKVYRYMGSKTINHYPNPDVAASWNPSWRSINTIDCAGLTVGPTMALAPAPALAQ